MDHAQNSEKITVHVQPWMIIHEAPVSSEKKQDSLLSVDEAAARLGVKVQTIQRWCRRGVLPYVRIETLREFRFEPFTLDKWIAERNGYFRGKKKIA